MTNVKIQLKPINAQNLNACERLFVKADQRQYIADNAKSLKDAEDVPEVARPFAIYANDQLVGFTMFAFDENNEDPDDKYWLWRFMIDEKEQGKGYGKAALEEIIGYFKRHGADTVTLSTKETNKTALDLYHSFGFRENGQWNNDEIVLKLALQENNDHLPEVT